MNDTVASYCLVTIGVVTYILLTFIILRGLGGIRTHGGTFIHEINSFDFSTN